MMKKAHQMKGHRKLQCTMPFCKIPCNVMSTPVGLCWSPWSLSDILRYCINLLVFSVTAFQVLVKSGTVSSTMSALALSQKHWPGMCQALQCHRKPLGRSIGQQYGSIMVRLLGCQQRPTCTMLCNILCPLPPWAISFIRPQLMLRKISSRLIPNYINIILTSVELWLLLISDGLDGLESCGMVKASPSCSELHSILITTSLFSAGSALLRRGTDFGFSGTGSGDTRMFSGGLLVECSMTSLYNGASSYCDSESTVKKMITDYILFRRRE